MIEEEKMQMVLNDLIIDLNIVIGASVIKIKIDYWRQTRKKEGIVI